MHIGGQRNRDSVQLRLGQHLVEVVVQADPGEIQRRLGPLDVPGGSARVLELGLVGVTNRRHLDAGQRLVTTKVHLAHEPQTDDAYSGHRVLPCDWMVYLKSFFMAAAVFSGRPGWYGSISAVT